MSMTPAQIIAQIEVAASTALPYAPPGIQLAYTLAINALHAVQKARNNGADVTQADLDAIWAANDQAKADDLKAQQEALARAAAVQRGGGRGEE